MRILVRRGHSLVNDLRFEKGTIYIGRQPKSQIFLPDQSVSRQHAVLVQNHDGDWMIRDLDSANRTLVNGRPVSKMPLHEGDIIGISDFILEVHFEATKSAQADSQPLDLGETVVGMKAEQPSVFQTKYQGNAYLRLSCDRLGDFYKLCLTLNGETDEEVLLRDLMELLLEQFDAYHVWGGLRETTSGPLTCHGGCRRGGGNVSLEDLIGRKILKQAIEKESYILLPNVMDAVNPDDSHAGDLTRLHSAMSVPIVGPAGAYGVLYVDNGVDQAAYTRQDLDYLTIISTFVAALSEHIA